MNRQIQIGHQKIVCKQLDAATDTAFNALFAEFFIAGTCSGVNSPSFIAAAWNFFDGAFDITAHNAFFENFTLVSDRLVENNHHTRAYELWQSVIELTDRWENRNQPRRVHKGTPYYFWGQLALERGDLDYGYSLIHQAFIEDRLSAKGKVLELPALALITLNADKVNDALRSSVVKTAQVLQQALVNYETTYGQPLSYADFQKRFLECEPAIDSVFLLGYTVARLNRLQALPPYLLKSEFGAQLYLNLLFDLLLVIDSSIKPHSKEKHFIDHAEFIAKQAGFAMTKNHLIEAEVACDADPEKCTMDLLDQHLSTPSGFVFKGPERDIALAYVLRNSCHSFAGISVIGQRMTEILQSVFNTLFLVVELFY